MPSTANVGFIDLVAGEMSAISVNDILNLSIQFAPWAMSNAYDAVIWTAFGIKFKEATGVLFSVVEALSYIGTLDRARFSRAFFFFFSPLHSCQPAMAN